MGSLKNENITENSQAQEYQATLALLQINRTTDLINTILATRSFKLEQPRHRLILITRKEFSTPLRFLVQKYFDHVYEINSDVLELKIEKDETDETLENIQPFLSQIASESIDVLINLSFSKASSHLAGFIKAQHKIGDHIDAHNRSCVNDKWSTYVTASVKSGRLNPFSLVDIYKNIIGLKSSDTVETPDNAPSKSNIIVLHPFSSHEEKCWKVDKWVEVIYKTLKDNQDVSLKIIGNSGHNLKSQLIIENPLLKQFSSRIFNATGKLDYAQTLKAIDEARLFLGHESAISHLTSFTSTPTLLLVNAGTKTHELVPYHDQAYVLSPKHEGNHEIPYQLVGNLVAELLNKKIIESEWLKANNSSFHLGSILLYKSTIENGRQQLHNLTKENTDSFEVFRNLYRVAWSFVLGGNEEEIPFPHLNPQSQDDLAAAMVGLQHLFELSEFGKKYSRYILEDISSQTPSIESIKENSKKIDEIDELQKLVEKTSLFLTPIINYHHTRKGNLFGENIVQLTESSYYAFEEAAHLSSVLYELIENTLANYQQITLKNKNIDFASR